MSINLSNQKRDFLLKEIEEIRSFINDNTKDINALKLNTYLNNLIKEVKAKKYGLIFEEHEENIDTVLKSNIPVLTENKDLYIDNSGEINFLIEGDNLASLKLLEKTHRESISLIYIDPPYNTGKDDFMYDDNFVDTEDQFRHSKWLSFMEKRLRIANNLLKDDGVIFISIDDNEQAALKLLCDEIFGEENRLSIHHIQVRYDNKSLNERKAFQECLEYVLIYGKPKFIAKRPKEEYSFDKFEYEIEELTDGEKLVIENKNVTIFRKGEWKLKKITPNIDGLKETWVTGSIYSGTGHGMTYKKIVEPRVQIDGNGAIYKIEGLGEDGLGYRYFTNPIKSTATKGKMFTGVPLSVREKIESGDTAEKLKTIPNFYDFSPDFGNIRHEGGVGFNSGKKPIKMLKQFLNYHTQKDITVLDFFAGSGSTGHAVLKLNEEDGGTRKFILCTNNENNICKDVTYKRLKNVLEGDNLKGSLKYFKVDYIPIDEQEYYEYADKLLLHVKELVELENHISFENNSSLAIVLNDDELLDLCKNIESENKIFKSIYLGHDLLLSNKQKQLFEKYNIKVNIIPEYYYPELNG